MFRRQKHVHRGRRRVHQGGVRVQRHAAAEESTVQECRKLAEFKGDGPADRLQHLPAAVLPADDHFVCFGWFPHR